MYAQTISSRRSEKAVLQIKTDNRRCVIGSTAALWAKRLWGTCGWEKEFEKGRDNTTCVIETFSMKQNLGAEQEIVMLWTAAKYGEV